VTSLLDQFRVPRLREFWVRWALRRVHYTDRAAKLDLLYVVEDPWRMESAQEQARFAWTNELISAQFSPLVTMLEIGCGEGHQSQHLSRLCARHFGIDVSARAVRRARRRCPEARFAAGDPFTFHLADMPAPVDLVVACEMLYYVKDIPRFLARMSRLGRACLVTYYQGQAAALDPHFAAMEDCHRARFRYGETEWNAVWWRNPSAAELRPPAGSVPEVAMLGSPGWASPTPSPRRSAKLGNLLRRLAVRSSAACRLRRGRLFREKLRPTAADSILDLGGGRGGHIAELVPYRDNVTIGDLDADALRDAARTYGFATLHLDGGETFSVGDGAFDVVFCSSVIEHVTGPKEITYDLEDGRRFAASARQAQVNFAAEIRRISKRYFVQTPYKYFPIEQHSFLPFFVVLLPRRWQVRLMRFLYEYRWFKPVYPDFRLLTIREMRALFPDAEIVLERYCGLVKSIVAIKT